MKNKTLFVGCGGSGIKTLTRLNELLSGNPETRQIMRENISYMIFDLDVSETDNFKDTIRKQVGNSGMPFIKAIQVTRNVTNLEELIRPTFDECERQSQNDKLTEAERKEWAAKLLRLKENWWYSPSYDPDYPKDPAKGVHSIPFRAQNIVEGLNQGAGQCGPVSFLTTWNYLPHLKQDLQEMVEAIQLRNTDTNGVGLNVVIVAGTAGGTGRGCWMPIAFKVTQTLREMGYVNNPTGVFFDSTCFKNVVESSPNERLNLSVNSLTAMSELSAWMMQPVIRTFQFALPDLRNPGTHLMVPGFTPPEDCNTPEKQREWYEARHLKPYTASTDVIAVPPDGDNELSPISSAYLIFGNNGKAALEKNDEYHEMAAAALYAMVAQDDFIGPGAVNRHDSVRSFGAITFEVPTIPIRRYMEAMVRSEYSKTLYMDAVKRPADKKDWNPTQENAYILDEEADQLVGVNGGDYKNTEPKKLPFFAKTKFCVDGEVREVSLIQPSFSNATLIQGLVAMCGEQFGWKPNRKEGFIYSKATDKLIADLESQDPDQVKSTALKILSLGNWENSDIEELLAKHEVLKTWGIDGETLTATIKKTAMNAFSPDPKDEIVSFKTKNSMEPAVGRAVAVVQKMEARIRQSIANLGLDPNDSFGVQIGTAGMVQNVEDCAATFASQVIDKYATKKFWELKRFSKAKIEDVCKEFQDYLTCAIYLKIRQLLVVKFNAALEELAKIRTSLKTLVDGLKKVREYFDSEMCKSCGVKGGDLNTAYRKLFIDEDLDEIFDAIPKMDATTNVYKRILKPIMSREKVRTLIRDNTDKNEKPIRECLGKFVREIVGGETYESPEEAYEAIRQAFSALISTNVSLKFKNNEDFMSRHFSFESVLKTNVDHWNLLLFARAGNEDDIGELKDRFRKYLGLTNDDYERVDGKFRIKTARQLESLWKSIVTSMAGDCKPWMELKESAHETYLNTIALVPTDETDTLKGADIRTLVRAKFPEKVLNANFRNGKHGDSIPKDRVIVYTAMAVTALDAENPFDSIKSLDYYKEADFSRLLVRAEDDQNLLSYFYPIQGNCAARVKWGEQRDTHGYVSPIFIRNEGLASTRWRPWAPYKSGINEALRLSDATDTALLFGLLGSGEVPADVRDAFVAVGWKCEPLFVKAETADSLKFSRKCEVDGKKNAWDAGRKFTTVKQLREFLTGKGRESIQGNIPALAKEMEAGTDARTAILAELAAFRTNVAAKVGSKALDGLKKALEDWLDNRDEVPNTTHKDIWKTLYEFACSDKFQLV